MNLNPTGVIALLFGIVLLYSGAKNMYPQDVIRMALGKDAVKGPIQDTGEVQSGRALKPKTQADTLPPASGVTVVTV